MSPAQIGRDWAEQLYSPELMTDPEVYDRCATALETFCGNTDAHPAFGKRAAEIAWNHRGLVWPYDSGDGE